jgi:two-component system, cell cycle response regulator
MNQQLLDRISQCPNLPSLPAIAVQVLDLTQKSDVDITAIARIISKDPALSGKILRTVNSSFYGRSQNVGTISHALVILGLQSVKTLVLGFSLVPHLTGDTSRGFKHLDYWKRSIYAATAARTIAAKFGVVQQEEAFLAALLQDIGMLVLDRVMGGEYGQVYEQVATHAELAAAEVAAFGADHAEVGGFLAGQWKLPPLLAMPIAFHHAPARTTDASIRKLADVVALAGTCADVFVEKSAAQPIALVRQQCKASHRMSEADCDAMLDEIGRHTREVASLFEINIGHGVSFEDILKKANETLVEITLQSQQQASTLVELNQQLRKEAWSDALTGLANRGRFDQFLSEQFAAANRKGLPLALVLLDVDKFKLVNDKHGHPAGDRVLEVLGALIRTAARGTDLAARYGGEEMALVLPATTRVTAAAIAESIRRAVAGKPIACDKSVLKVTVSLGVAVLDSPGLFKEPAHLLKAADLAVYAAKHAGRNCVRVFSLKPAQPLHPAA